MAQLTSTNPATGEVVGSVAVSSDGELRDRVGEANAAREQWRKLGTKARVELLRKALVLFEEKQQELALLITQEMGMPISQSITQDVGSGLEYFRWYLDNTEKYLTPEVTGEDENSLHTVHYEPIGTVAVITPWNFPFSNFVWGVIPNLLVGNTVVFKHSEECPRSGKFIEEGVKQAGLPPGVFTEVYGDGTVGEKLVNENIDLIWFTGSTAVGKRLYQIGAKKFIKVVLELGGSAPGIVFSDVDVAETVNSVYSNRFFNCGQACDALKRLIVHTDIAEKFIQSLKEVLVGKKVGNPAEKDTDIGPLVAERQVELLEGQVVDAITKGASLVLGGKPLVSLNGAYFEPTLLVNISRDMRVWEEEVFGPVLPIAIFETEEEAIDLANDTKFGLGAYLYTSDAARAERVAAKLESGMVSINATSYVCPFNPFGGYKESGLGREHGRFGLQELTRIKVVSRMK